MSAKSEDQIILKLILKGQSETDIIDHLKKRDMVDHVSIYRVKSKVREMKAAHAFLPYTPSLFDRLLRALFGVLLVSVGAFFLLWGMRSLWWTGMLGGGFLVVSGVIYLLKGFGRSRWQKYLIEQDVAPDRQQLTGLVLLLFYEMKY